MTAIQPRFRHSYYGEDDSIDCRDAENIAACALVAAKVYEAFGWVRWSGNRHCDNTDMHVPGPEALAETMTRMAARARAVALYEHVVVQVGEIRLFCWADWDGTVDFGISLGSEDLDINRAEYREMHDWGPDGGDHLDTCRGCGYRARLDGGPNG